MLTALPLTAQVPDPLQGVDSTVRLAAIDSLVQPLIGSSTPGLAMVVIHHGRILHRAGYGLADRANGVRFTTATPTYIASTGKMFTSLAVLRLVQEGKLSLDTTLARALPSAPAYAGEVTLAQMLTHTSGLIDHYKVGGEARRYTTRDVHAILAAADGLLFEPGSNNSYSNSAYVLLAEVVTRAAGMPFAAYLQQTFFTPFEMTGTSVVTGIDTRPDGRAVGYRRTDGGFEAYDYESSTVGAGGIYSTVDDLARFALALRAGGVLSPALLSRAMTASVRSDGKPTPYGMGWLSETGRVGTRRGVHYVAAVGSLRGFWALFQWYDEDDVQIIWASNGAANTTWDALLPLIEIIESP